MLPSLSALLLKTRAISTVVASLLLAGALHAQGPYRDLEASLALLPGLADSADQGAFVEVVKAMDEVYPGKIHIQVYPFARSVNNVLSGKADFHIPAMRNVAIPESKLPYRYAGEKIGSLAAVVYSRTDKVITRQDILKAVEKGREFPYVIEVAAGVEANCEFPARPTNNWEQSFKKLASGRIDAIWNAQDEADLVLRRLKLGNIHRSLWGMFDDVIVIQKGPHGEEVDRILSDLLKKLRASGRLEVLYRKVHVRYSDWQPADMGW